ncbi:MAG: 30S ribosomal protein S1 [bacterium]
MENISKGIINGMIKRAMDEVMRKKTEEEALEKEKPEIKVELNEEEEKEEKIEDVEKFYEEGIKPIEKGMVIDGYVVHVEKEGVLVSIGTKAEGFIPKEELSTRRFSSPSDIISIGDKIKVYVITTDDGEGNLILSKKRAEIEEAWSKVATAFEENKIISAKVIERVRGGLIVTLGIKGFIPISELNFIPKRGLNGYLNKTLKLKVIECNREEKKLIFSHKAALEEELKQKKQQVLESLYKGKICKGKVVRITGFGVFVDLGGIDGLIHVSELAYRRIKHPKEIVKVGDKIDVMVLEVDKEKEKISLSLKQTQLDPWQEVSKKFEIGSVVTGKVSRIADSYIFVHLCEGIEGLVPFQELCVKKISTPSDVVKEGQEVKVKVLNIKPLERRMSLSLKQVYQEEEKQKVQDYLNAQKNGLGVTLGDIFKEKFGDKLELIGTLQDKVESRE